MKRYRRIRHPSVLPADAQRWRDLANCALHFVTDGQTTEERLRGLYKLAGSLRPIGAAGAVNPCVRLREEVGRLIRPPFVPYRLRAGVDMEAATADNRGEVERFAREVLKRCAAFHDVDAAERRRY